MEHLKVLNSYKLNSNYAHTLLMMDLLSDPLELAFLISKLLKKILISVLFSCNLDISNFFDRSNNEMFFYDIYLKDRLTGKYIPVPILIKNFVDTRTQTPNTGSSSANFRFVRRFFLFDNVGGIETNNQYINGGNPSVNYVLKKNLNENRLLDMPKR